MQRKEMRCSVTMGSDCGDGVESDWIRSGRAGGIGLDRTGLDWIRSGRAKDETGSNRIGSDRTKPDRIG